MLFFFLEVFFYLLVPIALHAAFRLVALGVHAVLPVCSLVWLVASLFWVVVSLFRLAGHAVRLAVHAARLAAHVVRLAVHVASPAEAAG